MRALPLFLLTTVLTGFASAAAGPSAPTVSADGTWDELTPPRSFRSAAVCYDPVRDRLIVFGRHNYGGAPDPDNEVWALSVNAPLAWRKLAVVGVAPSPRLQASLIYDPVSDRAILFGGLETNTYTDLNDLWALSLAGTPSWIELSPTGTPPSPRNGHFAAYDPIHARMIVHGGLGGGYEVCALSLSGTPHWSEITASDEFYSTSSYDPRTVIYDPPNDRLVLFGHCGTDTTYEVDLAGTPHWKALPFDPQAPGRRTNISATYDPARARAVIYGGENQMSPSCISGGDCRVHEIWGFSLSGPPTWTQLGFSGDSLSAVGQTAVYDPNHDRLVCYGGASWGFRAPLYDAWTVTLSGTPNIEALKAWPMGRSGHSLVYDPSRNRVLVFGGEHGGLLGDVWSFPLMGDPIWTRLEPLGTPPSPRARHAAIYDPDGDRMIVFGGDDWNDGVLNDVWALSLAGTPAWTELHPDPGAGGLLPPPREGHTAVYDRFGHRMLVFGGDDFDQDGNPILRGDLWALSLNGPLAWSEIPAPSGAPAPRTGHIAAFDQQDRAMAIFGGAGGSDDLWIFGTDLGGGWTQLFPGGTGPDPQSVGLGVYQEAQSRMILWGTHTFAPRIWAVPLSPSPAWTALSPEDTAATSARTGRAIYDAHGDRMVVFAGSGPYDPDAQMWTLSWGGVLAVGGEQRTLPGLGPPVPNPARGETRIEFALERESNVDLRLYDIAGREVRSLTRARLDAGVHEARWDGRDGAGRRVQAGIYFIRLVGAGPPQVRRIALVE